MSKETVIYSVGMYLLGDDAVYDNDTHWCPLGVFSTEELAKRAVEIQFGDQVSWDGWRGKVHAPLNYGNSKLVSIWIDPDLLDEMP